MINTTDFKPIKKKAFDAQEWLINNTPFNSVSEYAEYAKNQMPIIEKLKEK